MTATSQSKGPAFEIADLLDSLLPISYSAVSHRPHPRSPALRTEYFQSSQRSGHPAFRAELSMTWASMPTDTRHGKGQEYQITCYFSGYFYAGCADYVCGKESTVMPSCLMSSPFNYIKSNLTMRQVVITRQQFYSQHRQTLQLKINYNINIHQRPGMHGQQQKIEQQIHFQMDEENDYNIEFQQSENKSVQFDQSKVNFKRYGVVVNKFGAKGAHEHQVTVEINPDLIKEQRRIGKGSAGQVWLATYNVGGKEIDVAIKEIPVQHKQSRDQFVKDLNVFLTANSPYLVNFYGCYYKEGYLTEVIEYMNMGSLRDMINFNIKNNYLQPMETVLAELSYCILEGLKYIHKEKRQIHRDIKPQNILINTAGEVKITDFGICKQLEKTVGLSSTWVGTQVYMSPQRIQCGEYSSNCDIWSFGLVLWELATSKELPYKKSSSNEPMYLLMQKIKTLPVPSFEPSDNRSPEFSHFLSRCLQKDPKNRASEEQLLQHPWLVNNSKQKILKEYIKVIHAKMKNSGKTK